ncbi:TetR family transcriptional regulator [Amycolatopsis antarctica]|uniref:TetR family transcriptional regulator n=1 Tax=Amycolatopsis antarctica TaxID=1854586 RepID=A0A263D5Q7_9PSEU|nr:TetR/AcrR family transcriptional regulator [Amycolatopsis antarctica]OZM73753.1 TetR family transcriptional regulator [Amycolatopsis antarctica]
MDTTRTPARRPRDRKNQLATVAAGLFRARGYHGVGINDIAAAAGVTGPALYRHFADKQSVLAHVLLSGIADMETVTERALADPVAPAPEQVNTLLRNLAEQAVERRELTALWRWEGRNLGPDHQREIRRRSAGMLAEWNRMLRALRPGLDVADAEVLCWAGMSVFGSVSVHRTTLARKRFTELLGELARRVLHVTLPDPAEHSPPTPPAPLTEPSRREQVLTAATELFRQRGFAAVSMEDIGAAVGIAGPSVYRHFPSKAGLLTAICRRAADRIALGAEYALRTSAPPDERAALRGLVESYVHTLTASSELAVSFSSDPAHVSPSAQAELVRTQRDYVAQWVSLLVAVHPGLSEREAKITVHAALTVANDLARTRRVNGRPGLEPELVTLLVAVLDLA